MHTPTPAPPLPEREPDEPARWHARLCAHVLAGPRRSVDETWRREGEDPQGRKGLRAPGSWRRAAERWRWTERAARHDAEALAREAEELAEQRRAERTRRRLLVSLFMGRAGQLLSDPRAFAASPAAVSVAVARAVELSRQEFGCSLPDPDDNVLVPPGAGLDPVPFVEIVIVGAERMNVPGGPVITETSVAPGFKFRRD